MTDLLASLADEFALASMLASYPTEALAGLVASALQGHDALAPLARSIAEPASSVVWAERYVELFERGKDRASLYETEYGRMRGMSKGNDLADIAGFYRAFGVTLDEARAHETCDHVGVELEFYAYLLAKQAHLAELGDGEGCDVVEDGRRKFLRAHLGAFVRAIAARPNVEACPVYGSVFRWCATLVAAECERLSVTPAPLDFFADQELESEVKCKTLPVVS